MFGHSDSIRFTGIHFLDDFLRSDANGLLHHAPNLRAIASLFSCSAERAGIPTTRSLPTSAGGNLDVNAHMKALGLPCSPAGWAAACDADLEPWEAFSPLTLITRETLVIGWCMPPSLIRFLDKRGITFVDLEISAIRFCRCLKLWARTNDKAIRDLFENWADDPEEPWLEAAIMRSSAARQGITSLSNSNVSVGVFVGQTELDLALVENGRLRQVQEVADQIAALARTVDVLAIKPHPYAKDDMALRRLHSTIPNLVWTSQNLYTLFCADNVRFVCGLSSGSLLEAGYFKKATYNFIRPDRTAPEKLPSDCSSWMAVSPGIASLAWLQSAFTGDFCESADRHGIGRTADAMREAFDRIFKQRWALDRPAADIFSVELDRQYEFFAGSPITSCLSYGWCSPESWGVWSSETVALLCLPFQGLQLARGLKISITGQLFAAERENEPSVIIRSAIPGVTSQTASFSRDGDCEIVFDQHVLEAGKGFISLEFLMNNPATPASLGMGDDDRLLGFGLMTLRASLVS